MEPNNNSKQFKVGVVGLGKMGIMHACLLNTFPNVKVSALCDKSRLMRLIAKRAFHGAVITDRLDKFAGLDLDAIYVLTPITSHYSIVKEIYDKDLTKNVFVEKTLASNYDQSKELNILSQNHTGVNMVGYHKRFGVTFKQAKTFLDEHALGELVSFDAYAFSSDFADVPAGSSTSKARGGVLEDLGSHVVDLAVWFFEDLNVISTKVDPITKNFGDSLSFEVNNSKKLSGNFEVSWIKNGYRMPEFGMTIEGTNGTLNVNDDEIKLDLNNDQPKRWYRQDLGDNVGYLLGGPEYYREDKHFVDCLVSEEETRSDFRNALRVDYLLEQVRRKIIQ